MKKEFYMNNRKSLINELTDGSVVILFAGKVQYKSAEVNDGFSVNKNFLYMTGIDMDEQILVIVKKKDKVDTILFVEDHDELKQKWYSDQMTIEQAQCISGIGNIRYLSAFHKDLHRILRDYEINTLFLDFDRNSFYNLISLEQAFAEEISKKYRGIKIEDIYRTISKLRSVKSVDEIEIIKEAINITKDGLEAAMKAVKPGMYEYELEAEANYVLNKKGVKETGFCTIVAEGGNACLLHYHKNNDVIKDNSLVVIDMGAVWNHYSADITRTFPANGKFTERQKQLYRIVLEANKKAIAAARPGVTPQQLTQLVVDFYTKELSAIGLIKEPGEVSKYFYHSIGHLMGMDVHDVGNRSAELRPGNIHTIEPGLYIADEGIAIRIEDDVLITESGCINLSSHIPKEIEEIENLMMRKVVKK